MAPIEAVKRECRHCDRIRPTRTAQRFGGGNYRRPGRWYNSAICQECAGRLLRAATPGTTKTDRWSISSLKRTWPEAVPPDPDAAPPRERTSLDVVRHVSRMLRERAKRACAPSAMEVWSADEPLPASGHSERVRALLAGSWGTYYGTLPPTVGDALSILLATYAEASEAERESTLAGPIEALAAAIAATENRSQVS